MGGCTIAQSHRLEDTKMNKRCLSPQILNKKFDISGNAPKILLSRDKAEKMCKKKLRQTKKINSNLCQTVLVKNTLKYVRSCKHFILASEPTRVSTISQKVL